jgi:hypothetical protein
MNKPSTTEQPAASTEGRAREEGVVEQAKQTASNVASRTKDGVSRQIELRKERAVGTMHDVADAVRKTGEKLEAPLPAMAERIADGIERVSRFVESHEVRDAVRGVEQFARREPALFLGSAVGIGLLAGRFLKSSPRRTERESESEVGSGYAQRYAMDEGEELEESYAYGGYSEDVEELEEPLAYGSGELEARPFVSTSPGGGIAGGTSASPPLPGETDVTNKPSGG